MSVEPKDPSVYITNQFVSMSEKIGSTKGDTGITKTARDAMFTIDINYKQLSSFTGKKYRMHRDNSRISFDEMTNIIKDPKVFDKFTPEQKETILISYNNMKNQLKDDLASSSNNSLSGRMSKLFKKAVPYKSNVDKAQEVITREASKVVQDLKKQYSEAQTFLVNEENMNSKFLNDLRDSKTHNDKSSISFLNAEIEDSNKIIAELRDKMKGIDASIKMWEEIKDNK